MMTRADRRRFPILLAVIAALAMAMLFSPVQAQEGSVPDQPTGLTAEATHGQVVLTWDDPQDDSITGYVILRRVRVNDTGGDFDVLLANTNTAALTYTDDTVAASLTYTYRIKAINQHGVSERSRWFHIDTPAAPAPEEEQAAEPPGQPTGLEATATHDSVTLTWDDPGDDSITGYVVLRRIPGVDPEGQFSELVSNTGTDATTYTDDTVSAETRYTYRIKAINEHGVSERSRWSHINVPAAPEAAEGDEQDGEGDGGGGSGGPGKRANVSEPSGDDLPESTSTTGEVDVGGSVTGNIDDNDDEDWFKVELEAGTRYQIDLEGAPTSRGTLPDPYMDIRSAAAPAVRILIDDDGGVGTNSRVIYTPTAAGTYYLEANTASGAGTYTLSMIVLGANGNSEADTDFPGTTATTGRVEVGASATGNIGTGGDQDWFKVVLEADKTYRIDMNGSNGGGGTLNDTRLSNIRDSSGNEISGTGNDDIDALNSNLDSQTTFTPTEAGAYYLVALGGGGTVTGTYTLSVHDITPSDDCTADTDTTCEVDVGGSVTGNIETEDDEDWFKVVLEADKTYQIDMKGEYGGGGTLEDPLLDNIRDSSGTGISDTGNDDVDADNDNYDSRTTFTPTTAGAYYLVATTADDSGTYTLSVREIQCTLNEGDIWCGVVTVAEVKSGENLLAHGFADTTSPATLDAGSLAGNPDDRTFPVGDNEYTVQGLYVATGGDRDGWLVFWITDVGHLDDHDEGILVLTIDGVDTPRAFDGNQGVLGGLYQWDADLDWSMETDVTVRLQTPDDFSAGTTTTGEVDVGGSATGNIETVADYGDWFKVELEAGTRYQIDLEGADTGRGTLVDPGIELLANSIGNTVPNTGGSDSGVGKNDRTIYTPSTSDAYYVVVQPSDTGLGTYTLSVIVLGANGNSEADTDFPDTTSTTGRVEVGASATGNIHTNGNRDAFRVDLEAGKVYQVDLEGAGTNKGSLDDPQLFAIADSTGSSISGGDNNDISSSNLNSRVTFTPTDAGSYYVLVRGNGTSTGTYTVTVIQQAAADTTAPSVDSATVSAAGAAIDIVFDEPLDETSTPSTTAFLAGISGIQTDRAVPNNVAVSGDTVTLTIRSGNTIAAGAIVTLAYTAPSTNALADASDNEVESFTGTDAIAVLNRPAAPVVTLTAGDGQLTATWAAPANGGSAITGYDVEWKTAAQTWAEAATAGQSDRAAADATDHEITSLTNNTEYTVRVRAANGAGNGPWSAEASETPAPQSDDCPGDTTTTCEVDVGGSVTGNITSDLDNDWFRVDLKAGTRYQIDLEGMPTAQGTLPDPVVEIRDADNTLDSEADDDGGVDRNARLIYTPDADGTYYLVARLAGSTGGTYTLSVIVLGANGNSEADTDFPETTSTGGRVEVGASATGNIETGTDRDWFKVDLEEGKLYQIDLKGEGGGGTQPDPYLRNIRDSSGAEISGTENDDIHGGNADSRVVFTPTAAGAYYLVASGYGGANDTGTYTLSVTELETRTEEGDTDFAASIATLGRVEVDGSATGEIKTIADADWFRVVLEAGKTYVFDLEGTATSAGTLPDPYLTLLNASGGKLSEDDDGGDGANSRLEYTATASGIHYLEAWIGSFAESDKGTYKLSVREVACTLNEGDHWCGVVTVGDIEYNESLFARGYINVTGLSGGSFKGDTDIPVGSTYTFTGIYVPVTGSFENQLIFRMDADFTSDEKDALELHIDVDGVGSTWPMSEFADSTNEGQMIREGEDFDWSSATTVTVRLRPLTLPTLSVADAEGDEDDGVEFTATLTTAVSAKVTATWTASIESGDTASAADLAATKTGEVEFDADAMTATFTVPVTDDTTDEENETFTVTLSSPSSNAQLATDPTAKGTIRDDDPPVLSFKQASYTAAEGGSAVEVELMLTSALPGTLLVTITAEHGAGATAEDYTGISDGARAIFTAGQTRSVFEVTAFDDAFDEDDETVTFGFTIPSSADVTKGSVSEATLTLTDNDDPPTLSVGDVSGAEGTALTFTVTLSDESGKTVTVDYATSVETGDTATSGTDFTAKTSTTLTFEPGDPGDTTKTFTVQTTDDTDIEEDETFTVTLSNPSNATISDATAKGTINDDDDAANVAPSFSSSATISVAENQTTVGTVLAADSDADDSVTGYEITGGADQTLFRISGPTGLLIFGAAPDYEDADDSGTNNTYVVEVTATSGTGTRVKTATQTITVTVTNVDEGQSGTVTIDDTTPTVGDELTASVANVADPDGLPDPFAPGWKWYRTPDGGSETEITGETSATYTVVEADLDATLTVKASWTDNGGFANTLSSAPTGAVAGASDDPVDDCSADTTTTCVVDVGGSVTGNIHSETDVDWFGIDLVSDTRYQFDLEGDDTTRGNLGDPYL